MLDIKGDQKTLVQGSRFQDGISLPQNGEWDDSLLCAGHERQIGRADDYGVRFCRRLVSGTPAEGGQAVAVPNPRPPDLLHFVYATVWRHSVSAETRGERGGLGPYERQLRRRLLEDGPYGLQVIIGLSGLSMREHGPVQLAINPYRQRFGALNVMHFVLGRLDAYLLVDQRRFPQAWIPYLANDNDPAILILEEGVDLRRMPALRPVLDQMLKTPRTREARK